MNAALKLSPEREIALEQFSVACIREAPENSLLYNAFTITNTDDAALLQSITEKGILEPLRISRDGFLLSGHRRLAAARHLGLDAVPVIVDELIFQNLAKNERLQVLRTANQQREKSFDERMAEAATDIDPDAAYQSVVSYRAKRAQVKAESNVEMGARRKRATITTQEFLDAVLDVLEQARPLWPISNRAIHYRLLNNPPLTHDSKPDSRYRNETKPVNFPQRLSSLLTRARIAGAIPMEAICDDERPSTLWEVHQQASDFVKQQQENYLQGYSRDLLQSQPHHIEVIVEKKTQFVAARKVAMNYTIPVTAGKGFASLPPRHAIAQRYFHSAKDKLVLIFLTDFDPDGEQIAASFARSMRDDFGIADIMPLKAALTGEQVQAYDLPSSLEAKVTSPNFKRFEAKHGTRAVELEALPDDLFAKLLKDAIHSVLDVDAFNFEVEKEREEITGIEARRRAVMQLIGKEGAK